MEQPQYSRAAHGTTQQLTTTQSCNVLLM